MFTQSTINNRWLPFVT